MFPTGTIDETFFVLNPPLQIVIQTGFTLAQKATLPLACWELSDEVPVKFERNLKNKRDKYTC